MLPDFPRDQVPGGRRETADIMKPHHAENVDLLLIGGPQGSGKSSLATHWFRDRKRVNRDAIRAGLLEMTTGRKWSAKEWTPEVEPLLTEIEMAVIRHELSRGHQVVVDNTHILATHRAPYIELARELGKTTGCIFLALPLETCMERNRKRSRTIPEHVLADFHSQMEVPSPEEGLDFLQVSERSFPLH